jgi:hypothetical protein
MVKPGDQAGAANGGAEGGTLSVFADEDDGAQSQLALAAAADPLLDPDIDPRKAKRILANRLAAACSKKRKVQHVQELESRVKELKAEIADMQEHTNGAERELRDATEAKRTLERHLVVLEAHVAKRRAQAAGGYPPRNASAGGFAGAGGQ